LVQALVSQLKLSTGLSERGTAFFKGRKLVVQRVDEFELLETSVASFANTAEQYKRIEDYS